MAYAVALRTVRDPSLAEDATQEAYVRAFRRLGDLEDPAAFISWFRRIVITVALNARRRHRVTLLRLDDLPTCLCWTKRRRRGQSGSASASRGPCSR